MRLNSAPLNTASLGGASSAVRLVRLVVSQAVRVVGAVTSPVIKYGVIVSTVAVSGVVRGKRMLFNALSGVAIVIGRCGPRVLRNIHGSGNAFFSMSGELTGTTRVRSPSLLVQGVACALTGRVQHLVRGYISATVGLNGSATGISQRVGPIDTERTASISGSDRTAFIQGA